MPWRSGLAIGIDLTDGARSGAHNRDTVGHEHRFVDRMRDQEHGPPLGRWRRFAPDAQQLLLQNLAVPIDLPRPRTDAVRGSGEFAALVERIWTSIKPDALRASVDGSA